MVLFFFTDDPKFTSSKLPPFSFYSRCTCSSYQSVREKYRSKGDVKSSEIEKPWKGKEKWRSKLKVCLWVYVLFVYKCLATWYAYVYVRVCLTANYCVFNCFCVKMFNLLKRNAYMLSHLVFLGPLQSPTSFPFWSAVVITCLAKSCLGKKSKKKIISPFTGRYQCKLGL